MTDKLPLILLAEDNKANQFISKAMIETLGARVLIAENGLEVLDLLDYYLEQGAVHATPGCVVLTTCIPCLPSGKPDRVQAALTLQAQYHNNLHACQDR